MTEAIIAFTVFFLFILVAGYLFWREYQKMKQRGERRIEALKYLEDKDELTEGDHKKVEQILSDDEIETSEKGENQ